MAPSSFPLASRADPLVAEGATSQSSLSPVIIAGIVVACALISGVAIWLGIRYYRKRSSAAREEGLGSGFLAVRGIVRQEGGEKDSASSQDTDVFKGTTFSRNQMSSDVIMPQKAILRPDASRDEILTHYTAEGVLPRPFAPFMGGTLSGEPDRKRSSVSSFLSVGRNSFLSLGSSSHRFSVASAATSVSSTGAAGKRKIRQLFMPVLPDELVISLGERVTVVNSFDDGWCIVGRDGFGGEVELGAVPAWCFIKPSPGLRAERPLRTTSLGVTVNVDSGPDSRDDVMSWSNF